LLWHWDLKLTNQKFPGTNTNRHVKCLLVDTTSTTNDAGNFLEGIHSLYSKTTLAMAKINLRTISGRFIFMSVLFLVVISSLTILTVTQNRKSQSALGVIQEVRIPIRLITGNIIGSLDRVMSQQRAYMLSGNTAFKDERSKVYKDDIYLSVEHLFQLREKLPVEQRAAIDQIKEQVKQFEEVQNEILIYFEANMLPHMQQIDKTDSEEWLNLTEAFVAKLKAEKQISERIKSADNIRADLLKVITDLRNYQEGMLSQEMISVTQSLSRAQVILVSVSVAIFIFLLIYTIINIRSLKQSIGKPVILINTLASGALPDKIDESKDELNEILEAGRVLTNNIQAASQFALAIGEGRLDVQYKEASDKDVLGKSLLHMRERLQAIALDEQKRNWATAGMAELGNILRGSSDNSEELYFNVLSYLIKYVKSNQGALYLVENRSADTILKMVSCYAYNKKKYLSQEVAPGQGLVGQAYLEKEIIFIKEVPKEYIHITSGLGDAPPRSVLICPLLLNDEVFGVLEMASFKEFEKFEQEFMKAATEQVASVIASVKNNERTSALLQESQQRTEELRAQEEEMRQNMEELSATQEEMARKEREYMNKIQLLEETLNESGVAR